MLVSERACVYGCSTLAIGAAGRCVQWLTELDELPLERGTVQKIVSCAAASTNTVGFTDKRFYFLASFAAKIHDDVAIFTVAGVNELLSRGADISKISALKSLR